MTNQDNRKIIVLQNRSVEDSTTIAGVLAERLVLELFNRDGRLALLENGRLIEVTNVLLAEIIGQHILTVQPTFDGNVYSAELCSLVLDRQQLNDVVAKLLLLVARMRGQVKPLSDQLKGEIRMRARSGEPIADIQKHYNVSREVVQQLRAS